MHMYKNDNLWYKPNFSEYFSDNIVGYETTDFFAETVIVCLVKRGLDCYLKTPGTQTNQIPGEISRLVTHRNPAVHHRVPCTGAVRGWPHETWSRFNVKTVFLTYGDPHVNDKTVARPSYL